LLLSSFLSFVVVFTSGHSSGVLALEEILAVDLTLLAATGLGYHGVPADVELLAVLGVGEGRVGQHAAVGTLGISLGAGETISERFSLGVGAFPLGLGRPSAGRSGSGIIED